MNRESGKLGILLDRGAKLPQNMVYQVPGGKLLHRAICSVVATYPNRRALVVYMGEEDTIESAVECGLKEGFIMNVTRTCKNCFPKVAK